MPGMKLDLFDRRLLALVQRDADTTALALAEKVGLSASAVQRRLARLKAEGVITASIAVVDPEKVGRPTLFVVGLEVERERPELLAHLRAWLREEEAVQQVYYVTGSWDVIFIMAAPDMTAYESFTARLLAENPNVRRFTTNVTLSVQKRGLYIPVAAEESPRRS